MEARSATVNDLMLEYGDGPQNGPTLVFLVGFPNGWSDYLPILTALEPDFHVLSPSLRGFGRSSHAAPYRLADWMADVDSFIRAVPGTPVFGVGHSGGAWFGLGAAAANPDLFAAFVSLDQPLDPRMHVGPNRARREMVSAMAAAIRSATGAAELAARLASVPLPDGSTFGERLSPQELRQEARELVDLDPAVFDAFVEDRLEEWLVVPELLGLPGAFNGPLLFVDGDPEAGSLLTADARRYNADRYPWAERVEITGADHGLGLMVDPAPVAAEIRRFLVSR